jgi:pimeloyl-ACP methyl ester carboxylesterase
MTTLSVREWGSGQPVIALAPLGLDSSAFGGMGRTLARRGFRTIAVDLPGFGATPLPATPLTPAVLAAPVIELARSLEVPPIVLGVSLGGRVALEMAMQASADVRALIAVAPYLPWRRHRALLDWARLISPRVVDWLPLQVFWPLLRRLAGLVQAVPYLRDDELAQAGARLIYYFSCPATRAAFVSAARELALDPADGPDSVWTRLPALAVPSAFVWCEQDQLVSLRFSGAAMRACPHASQVLLPCAGHWVNGPHHRCLAAAVAELAPALLDADPLPHETRHANGVEFAVYPCVVAREAAMVPRRVVLEEASHD